MDIYEDQEWKTAPGVPSLLLWCLQHLEVKEKYLVLFVAAPLICVCQ